MPIMTKDIPSQALTALLIRNPIDVQQAERQLEDALKRKKVVERKALRIGDKWYHSAHQAAAEWASELRNRIYWRHRVKQPYGHPNPMFMESSFYQNLEVVARRRAMPIFKKFFS